MARVLVAIPTFDGGIRPLTFESAANLDWGEHEITYRSISGYDCAQARCNIANEAIVKHYDFVMFIDSDVVVPANALEQLIEHNKPVVLGYYAHQGQFEGKTCLCKPGDYQHQYYRDELNELRKSGTILLPVHGGGMGCALIKVDVFNKLDYPYFQFVLYGDRHGVLSEDLFFCEQCHNRGIPIFADTRVRCGHHIRHVEYM